MDNSTAQVSHLVDMVGYQDGAVVSRTVLKQPAGNVTLFAFDAGQELSEHTAPYDALVQVLEGEAEVTIAGRPHRRSDGTAAHREQRRAITGRGRFPSGWSRKPHAARDPCSIAYAPQSSPACPKPG